MAESEHIHNFRRQAKADHEAKVRHHSDGDDDFRSDAKMIKQAVAEHESNMHKGEPKTKIKFRSSGGAAEGESAKKRHDRPKRAAGGSSSSSKKSSSGKGDGKHGARVNVIIAPQHPPLGGGMATPGGASPLAMGPARPPGPPVPPPAPPMPAGGAGPMPPHPMPMPGAGGPPMMPPRKAGGRVNRAGGGATGVMPAEEKSNNQDGGKGREEQSGNGSMASRMKEQMGPYAKRADGGSVEDLEDKAPKGEGIGEVGAGGGLARLKKIRAYGDMSKKGEED